MIVMSKIIVQKGAKLESRLVKSSKSQRWSRTIFQNLVFHALCIRKLNIELPYDPAIWLLGKYTQN